MKTAELKNKSADELTTMLLDLKKEAFNLRFQKSSGELAKTDRIKVVRRTIAKIKTLQNQQKSVKETSPKKGGKAVDASENVKKTSAKK